MNIMPLTIFRDYQPSSGQRSDRSAGDRARHRVKVKQSIKDNIGDIVADESLIGKHGDKIIRVPIKGVKEYRFVYGDNQPQAGTGDGNSQPGQVVGKTGQPQDGQGKGDKAGDQPGIDVYETEITLDELKEILFEELQLPNLKKKNKKEIIDKSRAKKDGYRKMGIQVRLDRFKTAKQRVKRKKATLRHGDLDEICDSCNGTGYIDLEFLQEMSQEEEHPLICSECDGIGKIEKRFRFRREDRFYRHMETKPKPQSNAAIIFILDVSGSMDQNKKFLARSLFFVLHEFIKDKYDRSELVFIAHHTEAQEVDEDRFFHRGDSGGTFVSSGLILAKQIIENRYNPAIWNTYIMYMGDGDNMDSDNAQALNTMNELCKICNMVGYGEIKPLGSRYYESSMMNVWKKVEDPDQVFRSVLITKKEEIWPALKTILKVDESTL